MRTKLLLWLTLAFVAQAQTVINGSRVVNGTQNYCADAGSNDTYACTITGLTAYTTGACYTFKANTANTGAATVNFTSLGAKTIKKVAGGITTDLADNDIRAGQFPLVCYDGTNMQLQSLLGNAPSGGSLSAFTTMPYLPWGYVAHSSGNGRVGTDNGAWRYPFQVDSPRDLTKLVAQIRTAAASSGVRWGIMATNGDVVAETDALSTASTGDLQWTWQSGSGSLMSGSTLALVRGEYWLISCSDAGNTLRIEAATTQHHTNIVLRADYGTVGSNPENSLVGYRNSSCTGTGTSVDFNASNYSTGWTGYAGDGGFPAVVFLP